MPCIGATAEVRVVFPTESERLQWVFAEAPNELPNQGREFNSKEIIVPVPSGMEKGTIVIFEPRSGNIVLRNVDSIKGGVWTVAESEWRIAQVSVSVQQGGAPLPVGVLEAKWKTGLRQATIKDGRANLFAIPPREVTLTIRYGAVGEEKTSTESINLSLKREQTVPQVEVAVPGPPPTAAKAKSDPEKKPDDKPAASPSGKLMTWLIAIAIGIVVLLLAIRLLKKHEAKVSGHLQALGIQIPDATHAQRAAQEANQAPLVAEGHCQYCGSPLAPDGSCKCRSQSDANVARLTVKAPRLVFEDGTVMEIPGGTSVVGRDPASILVVADQSVSRKHAQFRREDVSVFLVDLGSTNGTFVNGRKVDEEVELKPGDTVQFGSVRIRFEA